MQQRNRFWRIFDYSEIDTQIEKFRKIAREYKQSNRA